MNKQHYSFTWDQVQNKWKSLVRTYKNVKDNNNETGRNRKTWIFFDKMDQLFAKNPAIDPPVVMHNGQRILKSLDDAPESSSQLLPRTSAAHVSSDDDSGSTAKRQRKSSDLNDILIRAIEQNQKQHEEDLQEKRKFNSLLESLIQNMKK
ncbi:hypothetical protein RI129_005739 [Pyrocoelia pectoralis]|uniref:Myb/SANT-like DNA-binding domain-containing protein n=1 Tax=Pyrocoelia pectoralis TaxID=417401 RepID=A0AAN7VDX8_9COLE